jgi:hypothetical protein
MATAQKKGRRRLYKTLVFLGAIGGLVWLLDHIGWDKIGSYLGAIPPSGLVVLVLLGFTEGFADSAALRFAITEKVSVWRVHVFNQAGGIVNTLIPWEAGEVLKGRLLSHHISGREAIVATVVWNYIFKISKPAAALTAATVGALGAPAGFREPSLLMLAAAGASFLPYIGFRVAVRLGPAGLLVRLAKRLHLTRKTDPEALLAQAREIDRAVRHFWTDERRAYVLAFICQYAARVVAWLTVWAALQILAPNPTYFTLPVAGTIYAGFSVMSYVVMLFPTRMGTTEAGGYALFFLLGLDPGLGLMTPLILRLKALATNAVPGAFVFSDKVTGGARLRQDAPAPAPDPAPTSEAE